MNEEIISEAEIMFKKCGLEIDSVTDGKNTHVYKFVNDNISTRATILFNYNVKQVYVNYLNKYDKVIPCSQRLVDAVKQLVKEIDKKGEYEKVLFQIEDENKKSRYEEL